MEAETTISATIRISDMEMRYDSACKRMLSERVFLAWIMKGSMKEYANCKINEIVEKYIIGEPEIALVRVAPDETNAPRISGTGVEDPSLNEGKVTFDIRFTALLPGTETPVYLIINVEAQNNFYPGYPVTKRGIYYGSRLLSSQYGAVFENAQYGKLEKVYSVWICTNPPKKRENTITRYAIQEENVVGTVKEPVQDYDLMTVVIVCLGNTKPEEEIGSDLLRMLNVLFSQEIHQEEKRRILQDEFDIAMTQKISEEVSEVGSLGHAILLEGLEQGRVEGREQGREEGLEKGISATLSILKDLNWEKSAVRDALAQKFTLSSEVAEQKVLQYWDIV